MNKFLLTSLLVGLFLDPSFSQDREPSPLVGMPQWRRDFLNLPEDLRVDYARLINKARGLFQQKRVFETIEELNKARAIFPDSPDLENLYGACRVEFRDFAQARRHFERANELAPNESNILFNLAEILFVTKQWEATEQMLERVLELGREQSSNLQMLRLVEFKLLLTRIKLGKIDEARELANRYDHFDDSPYPYYAEAAMAFNDGNELEAELALGRAHRVFRDPAAIAPWQDTLMEFGYIKSFFGGDLEERAELPAPLDPN